MDIDSEYLRMGGPVSDGWHFNRSTFEHQLYGGGQVIFTVTESACRHTGHAPQYLYGVARGIIAP